MRPAKTTAYRLAAAPAPSERYYASGLIVFDRNAADQAIAISPKREHADKIATSLNFYDRAAGGAAS